MAHTTEQRDKHALCGAKRKNGELCRKFAGEGTNHFGFGRCKYHLGNTQAHSTHAIILEAQQRMVELGAPIDIEPHEALLSMLRLASGHVVWLRNEIVEQRKRNRNGAALRLDVLMRLYNEERDRVAKTAKAALDAGVAERHVRVAERYGEQLAVMLSALFADPELALTRAQQKVLPAVTRRHLLAASAQDGDDVIEGVVRRAD